MKPHIRQAQKQAKTLERTGFIVKMVCFAIFCVFAFGTYSCLTVVKDEAKQVKQKLDRD